MIVAAGGYAAGRGIEFAAKRTLKKVKGAKNGNDASSIPTEDMFTVTTDGEAGAGLLLRTGDHFRVLSRDDDSILIEVLGNANNPYFVSGDLLRSISDFEITTEGSSEN